MIFNWTIQLSYSIIGEYKDVQVKVGIERFGVERVCEMQKDHLVASDVTLQKGKDAEVKVDVYSFC